MTLWLVRHAQPLVAPGVCYGATDLKSDPHATQQAALALAAALPQALHVRSSPLRRCTDLAGALQALRPELAYRTDARLAEMDFGYWEGWHWDRIGRAEIDRWTAAFGSYRFGGRESVQMLLDRVSSARRDAAALTAKGGSRADVLWITHAGVIRAAALLAQGIDTVNGADQWPFTAIGFGQWQRQAL